MFAYRFKEDKAARDKKYFLNTKTLQYYKSELFQKYFQNIYNF